LSSYIIKQWRRVKPNTGYEGRAYANRRKRCAKAAGGKQSQATKAASVPFKILHGALVILRGFQGLEPPKVFAFSRLGVLFSRVQPIFTRCQFSNHRSSIGIKR
jgi:hypothetical protein